MRHFALEYQLKMLHASDAVYTQCAGNLIVILCIYVAR